MVQAHGHRHMAALKGHPRLSQDSEVLRVFMLTVLYVKEGLSPTQLPAWTHILGVAVRSATQQITG